jgi:hypothetical protein
MDKNRNADAIDKAIVHQDVRSASTDFGMPPGILGAPMRTTPSIPVGTVPASGISSTLNAALPKLTPSLARGVRDVIRRK